MEKFWKIEAKEELSNQSQVEFKEMFDRFWIAFFV